MQNFGLFNTKKFGADSKIDLNNANFKKGGIQKSQIDKKYAALFDKIDTDKNGILDSDEMAAMKNAIDIGTKDGFVDKEEANKFLIGENGQNLTYTDAKGKEKELKGKDLNEFLATCYTIADKNDVKSATKVEIEGFPAVSIKNKDGSEVIIFDDKTKLTRKITKDGDKTTTTYTHNKTGATVREVVVDGATTTSTEFNAKGVRIEEVITENGITTTTNYSDDGDTPNTIEILNTTEGSKAVINCDETGKPLSSVVTKGSSTSYYNFDGDRSYLDIKFCDLGNGIIETSEYFYNEDGTEMVTVSKTGSTSETTYTKKGGKNIQAVTIEPGKHILTEYAPDGEKVLKQTTLMGENIEEPDRVIVRTNNDDGSYVEETTIKPTTDDSVIAIKVSYNDKGLPTARVQLWADGSREATEFAADGKTIKERTLLSCQPDGSYYVKHEQGKNIHIIKYNSNNHKTAEATYVGSKEVHHASFTGNGYGYLAIRAGETKEQFAARIGCPVNEIRRQSHRKKGEPLMGGEILLVPEQYVRADKNSDVRAAAEANKQVTIELQKQYEGYLTYTHAKAIKPNQYSSYSQFVDELINNEVKWGYLSAEEKNDSQYKNYLTKKIQAMNGGKPISSLSEITYPTSSMYGKMLHRIDRCAGAPTTMVNLLEQELEKAKK